MWLVFDNYWASVAEWLVCATLNLLVACSNLSRSWIFTNSRLISKSSVCEAKLRLFVIIFWIFHIIRMYNLVFVAVCGVNQLCIGNNFIKTVNALKLRNMFFLQHHCRKCGKALCANCCPHSSVMPKMGFEFPVRLCTDCFDSVPEADKVSLAKRHNVKSAVHLMTYDQSRSLIVTASRDNWIKVRVILPLFERRTKPYF